VYYKPVDTFSLTDTPQWGPEAEFLPVAFTTRLNPQPVVGQPEFFK